MSDGTKNGKCRRSDKLESAARSGSAQAIAALEDGPECPAAFLQLWQDWSDLARGRPTGLDRASLTWECLDAWARRRRRHLTHFEIDMFFELDSMKAAENRDTDD